MKKGSFFSPGGKRLFRRGYDGVKPTSRRVGDVLPQVLKTVNQAYKDRPDLGLAAWPAAVGSIVASMTEANSRASADLSMSMLSQTCAEAASRSRKIVYRNPKSPSPLSNASYLALPGRIDPESRAVLRPRR